MSARAILPGALLAGLLTVAAVLALVVALGIRGEGPLALDVGDGDGDGAARLEGGGSATLGEPTPGVRETAPVVLPGGGIAASVAGSPARRRASALRGAAGDRQVAGRRNARTPAGNRPVASPNAPVTTTSPVTTTRPTATSTPNPNAVKVRGRGPAAPKPLVNKRRVPPGGSATPAPVPTQPVPAPQAPELNRSAPPAPAGTPAPGAPPLTRVPPPATTP
jgi:hypothetical protein